MTRERFNAFDIWEKQGITEHLGGIKATEKLLENCKLKSSYLVLDIGCGTGYSAFMIAKRYGAQVVAADISAPVLERARERVTTQSVADQIKLVQSDIHALSFPDETFDVVICESVLVFCNKPQAIAEIYRVLKRGGIFGSNEFTFLQSPPPEWGMLLSSAYFGLDIQPLLSDKWQELFTGEGFKNVSVTVSRLSLKEQFVSHIRVDGWRKYLSAVVQGLSDRAVRATFFNRDMLQAWRAYPDYVGYGLYVNQKV